MRATARVWAATVVFGLALGIAHTLGLPDAVFAPARTLCSATVAVVAIAWIPRHARMAGVAGLLSAVAWFDAWLLPVDLGQRAPDTADVLLSFVALFATIGAYLVMATTQVPSDRRGAWAAMAWLLHGGTSIGVLFGLPAVLVLVALTVAVGLTVRFLLGMQLYEPSRDPAAAARGLRIYRRALVIHVLLACGVWPLILVVGAPHALALLLLVPYAALIYGASCYASAASNAAEP